MDHPDHRAHRRPHPVLAQSPMTVEMPEPLDGFLDCEWPLDPGCLGDAWDSYDASVKQRAQALAGATLRRLTGYRVGGCPTTVRPCKRACLSLWYNAGGPFQPHLNETSQWVNGCGCLTDCACTMICEVRLPGPVGAVYEVTIDGEPLETTDYRVSGTNVVWQGDGDCPFTACQDMNLPLTEAGTFGITYLNAYPVDGLGAWAGGLLAVEYAKACVGGSCKLPANVTAVVRQGVSFTLETGAFPSGFTGVREVDAYIALWNPEGLQRTSTIWTPRTRFRTERA